MMNKTILFKICIVFTGIFLMVTVNQTSVQAQQSEAAAVEEQKQQKPKDIFKFEESIVNDLEGRIPDEKFEQIGELKDKEFSETGMSEALKAAAFSEEEIETVLNLVHERLKFVEAIKKAAPVALAMDKVETDIRTQEEVLEKTHQEDERKKNCQGSQSTAQRAEKTRKQYFWHYSRH